MQGETHRSHAQASRPDTIRGTLKQFRAASTLIAKGNARIRRHNRAIRKSAAEQLRRSIPVAGTTLASAVQGDEAGTPPSWSKQLDLSHDLRYAAGAVFCRACGGVLCSLRKGAALLAKCRVMDGFEIPSCSKNRLARLQKGNISWKTWPDGRSAETVVKVRSFPAAKVSSTSATLVATCRRTQLAQTAMRQIRIAELIVAARPCHYQLAIHFLSKALLRSTQSRIALT